MPRTAVTPGAATAVQVQQEAPVALTEAAADNTNGNSFANTGKELLIVRVVSGSPTLTLRDVRNVAQGGAQALTSGKSYVFGPFDQTVWGSTVAFDVSTNTAQVLVAKLVHRGLVEFA